jgi:hypothetical protein
MDRGSTGDTEQAACRAARFDGLYWIDDEGTWRRADPDSPFVHLREPIAEGHQGHAFRWLGMVRAIVRGRELQLKWDVRRADPRSLDSVDLVLADGWHSPVHLEFFHGGWTRETYTDCEGARRRLERSREFRHVDFIAPLTVVRQLPELRHPTRDILLRADLPLIDRALAAWEVSQGVWDQERPIHWLRDHLTVMSPPPDRVNAMLVHHMGAEHGISQFLGREAAAAIQGKRCAFPWVSRDQLQRLLSAYREADRSGRPQLEDIRVLTRRSDQEPAWVPYRRLTLPCHTRDGRSVILSLCDIRQDISIPFMGETTGKAA